MTSVRRRCAIAVVALAAAAALLRGQVALALVYRGDDAMSRANVQGAAGYYRRALLLDSGSNVATDRLSFAAFLADDPVAMRTALFGLDAAIAADGTNLELRRDRALLELRGRKFDAALNDFAFVGRNARDARALAFAGILASRARECRTARRLLAQALELDSRLVIARRRMARAC